MFSLMFSCVSIVLCVPFLTLFERKVLSYTQNRKGPNKISLKGLLQPIVDGIKLIIKESGKPFSSKKILFFLSPLIIFCLSLSSCFILTKFHSSFVMNFNFLFFLIVVSCKVYPLFFSGASSKSKYSSLGSFRGAAQIMAYEVNAVLMLLFPFLVFNSFNSYYYLGNSLKLIFPLLLVFWIFCMVSETNRAPFDFAEGESELVSGFKTEYSGLKFTFLFLAEYSKMIMMSVVTSFIFFSSKVFITLTMIYFFVSFRASFPRFRYDLLMVFGWKVILGPVLFFFAIMLLL